LLAIGQQRESASCLSSFPSPVRSAFFSFHSPTTRQCISRSVLRLVTRREGLSRQGTSMTSMNIGTEACTQELLLVLTPVIRTACPACRMSVTVLIESTDRVCRAASHSLLACLPCQGGEGTGRNLSVCRLIRDAEVRTSPAWYITKVGAYLHVAENEYSPFCFSFRASRASVRGPA
jgi:hypothetical protein